MKKVLRYINLYKSDKSAFKFQLWMVYNRYKINTFNGIIKKISNSKGKFITFNSRPISAEVVNSWSDPLKIEPKIAIVLQGQIKLENNFTVETVRIYKKHFANTIIIVSTDEGENIETLKEIESLGAFVVKNKKPAVAGVGNINLQLLSTISGIKKAAELGAEFVYKTRTDQRMYATNINELMLNLLNHFPVKVGFKQKYRIVASSFLSLKYVPYLITDMFLFGQIDDMLQYWSAANDTRTGLPKGIHTVQDLIDAHMSESYLCSEFLKSIGRNVTFTVADSWQAYADHFCIVDSETLDLFWYKYDSYQEYRQRRYDGIGNNQLLTFAEWFNLYVGLNNKQSIPEYGLALPCLNTLSHPNNNK